MSDITSTEIRMYRMGTGDCFILKFFAGDELKFKMMIDCGTWSGGADHLTPYIADLKAYIGNGVDALVVTHEHKDHVHVFEVCEELFTNNFTVGQIWMAWTEEEKTAKVTQWQQEYGDQKKALAKAASRLKKAVNSPDFKQQLEKEHNGMDMLGARKDFADAISDFTGLQIDSDDDGNYIGPLKGMKIVKEKIATGNIRYFRPGDLITQIENLPGIRFFVLGPPENWEQVKMESGGKGESYDHNKDLTPTDAFAMAVLHADDPKKVCNTMPFDEQYCYNSEDKAAPILDYQDPNTAWRRIDNDWLYSTGALAMRINSITNNLSLALAIEFTESGKVMLFPGDAEFGSWASWHDVKWTEPSRNKDKPLMEDLLNRTVFYKVAHHLSHNGTAKRLGMEMMTHPDLVAMATLDYNIISPRWKTTMPNRGLLQDLIRNSKGRLIVMNPHNLFYDVSDMLPLQEQIELARSRMNPKDLAGFNNVFKNDDADQIYYQFTVDGTASNK